MIIFLIIYFISAAIILYCLSMCQKNNYVSFSNNDMKVAIILSFIPIANTVICIYGAIKSFKN